ncbi:MAG: fatty acid desaturase [Acidobacteria bacterium]|nr:fatty acid desaturase [Acidobacteriota bacterium]
MLPTDRLGPNGRPTGDLRNRLYRIPDLANVGHVAGVWIQSVGLLWLVAWWDHPIGWIVAFPLMGRAFARFAILAHEAAHRLLFSNRRANDLVGAWLIAYPAFVPIDAYRRGHMAHHKREFGPAEPDVALYAGYPIGADSWRRKLTRDSLGSSGWKNLMLLVRALASPTARPVALRIAGWQVALWLGLWALTGRWWAYPLFWLLPWMTVWRVLNRLRAVAEHGGMQESDDRRRTTHHVRQSPTARFWMVPFNTGWHLAHHVDIGVPFARLPEFHRELEAAGYVSDELAWPTYRSLWRHAHRRP